MSVVIQAKRDVFFINIFKDADFYFCVNVLLTDFVLSHLISCVIFVCIFDIQFYKVGGNNLRKQKFVQSQLFY